MSNNVSLRITGYVNRLVMLAVILIPTETINGLGQTPCLVAAYLESGCGMRTQIQSYCLFFSNGMSIPTAARVDRIPSGTHYVGPSSGDANGCYCSSVTYSAISACAGCQDRSYLNWTMWSYNCTAKYEAS